MLKEKALLSLPFFFKRESFSSSQTGIPGWREWALFGAEAETVDFPSFCIFLLAVRGQESFNAF